MCVDYEELMIKKEVKMSESVHSSLSWNNGHTLYTWHHSLSYEMILWKFSDNCHLKPQTHPKHEKSSTVCGHADVWC